MCAVCLYLADLKQNLLMHVHYGDILCLGSAPWRRCTCVEARRATRPPCPLMAAAAYSSEAVQLHAVVSMTCASCGGRLLADARAPRMLCMRCHQPTWITVALDQADTECRPKRCKTRSRGWCTGSEACNLRSCRWCEHVRLPHQQASADIRSSLAAQGTVLGFLRENLKEKGNNGVFVLYWLWDALRPPQMGLFRSHGRTVHHLQRNRECVHGAMPRSSHYGYAVLRPVFSSWHRVRRQPGS